MSNIITVLPTEVQELSTKVEASKQVEVKNILNEIFTQTANWNAEIEAIQVESPNDIASMEKARQLRLVVKNARLEASKKFKAKRDEVQIKMVDFKTEDTLWLKAAQSMEAVAKGIETKAEWKEKFAERFEAEQKEAKAQTRLAEIRIYKPEIQKSEIENLTDDIFEALLSGAKKSHEDKIKADELAKKIQEENEAKESRLRDRMSIAFPFSQFFDLDLRTDPSQEEFETALKEAKDKFELDKAEKARLQAELDKANQEKQEQQAKEAKEKADREAKEKADLQAKLAQEESEKAEKENEEKARKNEEYGIWLKSNKYNPVTDTVTREGDKFILTRKISEIVIA
jgi:hypothetical protein